MKHGPHNVVSIGSAIVDPAFAVYSGAALAIDNNQVAANADPSASPGGVVVN